MAGDFLPVCNVRTHRRVPVSFPLLLQPPASLRYSLSASDVVNDHNNKNFVPSFAAHVPCPLSTCFSFQFEERGGRIMALSAYDEDPQVPQKQSRPGNSATLRC
eukprot:3427213-Rhodomonas_salina.3